MNSILTGGVIGFGILSLLCFFLTFWALRKKKVVSTTIRLLLALLFLALTALFALLSVSITGYRALIHEEIAAVVHTQPDGEKTFVARFSFPDGREATYRLAGDALYVDAHILKWKPVVNILGLHTAYELDRVSGRYMDIEDETVKSRTVFSLSGNKRFNMFCLRQRYAFLQPLLDAQYGSATFVPVNQSSIFEIRVSTTGLLVRPVE